MGAQAIQILACPPSIAPMSSEHVDPALVATLRYAGPQVEPIVKAYFRNQPKLCAFFLATRGSCCDISVSAILFNYLQQGCLTNLPLGLEQFAHPCITQGVVILNNVTYSLPSPQVDQAS